MRVFFKSVKHRAWIVGSTSSIFSPWLSLHIFFSAVFAMQACIFANCATLSGEKKIMVHP